MQVRSVGKLTLGAVLAVLGALNWCAAAEPTIEIGQQEQLFLDDYVIGTTAGIVRRVNQVEKRAEPVLRPTEPWEKGRTVIFGTAIRDSATGLFRMWYYSAGNMAYATSKDGLVWEKPAFDMAPFGGEKTNVVVWRTPNWEKELRRPPIAVPEGPFGRFHESLGVLVDPREPDPSRRYKTAFVSINFNYKGPQKHPNQKLYTPGWLRGMGTAVSPDGLHWKLENSFASYEVFDIAHLIWDASRGRYVVYGRTFLHPGNNKDGRWVKWAIGRAVTRIESPDFRQWSAGELVMGADKQDPPETEIYSMGVLPYEGVYIGLVQMYYHVTGKLDLQLAVSRDGHHFTRVEPRVPFIPEGKEGAWDQFNISIGDAPPIAVGEEMWFYYGGRNCRHPGHKMEKHVGPQIWCIGLAKIKRGRFLALAAGPAGGTVVTKPLSLQERRLSVNANAAGGSIRITVLDSQERPLPGYEAVIRGQDAVSIPVRFEMGDLVALKGKPVIIRFELSSAELFGFRAAP
jgi:hypothetical protein